MENQIHVPNHQPEKIKSDWNRDFVDRSLRTRVQRTKRPVWGSTDGYSLRFLLNQEKIRDDEIAKIKHEILHIFAPNSFCETKKKRLQNLQTPRDRN